MHLKLRSLVVPVAVMGAMIGGCDTKEIEQKASDTARDVAMVERMSEPPLQPVVPSPISDEDMQRYGLDRASCAFRKEGVEQPLFLAGSREGFTRIDNEIQRYAAKRATADLPGDARTSYVGLAGWVDLVRLPDEGTGAGQNHWPARLILHDARERVAFTADGWVTCKG